VLKHRLEPQTLSKALGKQLLDNETLTEALAREEHEASERETQVRKLNTKRTEDIKLDLKQKLLWQARADGKFVLEVGLEKHRIALVPCKGLGDDLWGNDGYYRVVAKLAPLYQGQYWCEPMPLGYAQELAEKKVRMLLADASSVKLMKSTARWRSDPATETQLEKIQKYVTKGWIKATIPTDEEGNYILTKGEAGDLLDPVFEMFQKWDEKRKAKAVAS
jgi:hypothetical protein